MKVFLLIRSGVYMQGVFGVYSTMLKAAKAKNKYIEEEEDDYHDFTIVEMYIDETNDTNKVEGVTDLLKNPRRFNK